MFKRGTCKWTVACRDGAIASGTYTREQALETIASYDGMVACAPHAFVCLNDGESYSTHWGKFNSPMAEFIYERVILDGCEDDHASDGDGEWCDRVGRWVIDGDNQGFVSATKMSTVAEAEQYLRAARHELEGHEWGEVEYAALTGNPHRKCQFNGCNAITLDLDDEAEVEF